MASATGTCAVYFQAHSDDIQSMTELEARQVARETFESGVGQQLRFFLTKDSLEKCLENWSESKNGCYTCVVDLSVDQCRPREISMQRSLLKFGEDGESVSVSKQWVRVGSVIRCLEPLYGTIPNAHRTSISSDAVPLDSDGGDCVICMSKPRSVAILHCRHVCLCSACAKITSSTWSFQCPVCRGRVAAMVGVATTE